MTTQLQKTSLILYEDRLELQLDPRQDTVWASQAQIAELFDVDRTVITKHIRNIFKTGELNQDWVCAIFAHTADDGKTYQVQHYNLDVILAVWYRTNSRKATRFRQWATTRLKEYLIQGYSINQKRLGELHKTIELISHRKDIEDISLQEARWLIDIIASYSESFALLGQFDSWALGNDGDGDITYTIEYNEAKEAIVKLRNSLILRWEATELFGNEKDEQFGGILQTIAQTFDDTYLYPTIESQAAHLLYFIIKDHPFSDGNKRIGAFLFIWFLDKNKHRFRRNGLPKINESWLVSLALLIATSPPSEKEILIKLTINLITNK